MRVSEEERDKRVPRLHIWGTAHLDGKNRARNAFTKEKDYSGR